jgi:hypothetical protein
MFTVALIIKTKSGNKPNVYQVMTGETNWSSYTVEYYLAIKKQWGTNSCYNIDESYKRYAV